jgi:hypothetical protein
MVPGSQSAICGRIITSARPSTIGIAYGAEPRMT